MHCFGVMIDRLQMPRCCVLSEQARLSLVMKSIHRCAHKQTEDKSNAMIPRNDVDRYGSGVLQEGMSWVWSNQVKELGVCVAIFT